MAHLPAAYRNSSPRLVQTRIKCQANPGWFLAFLLRLNFFEGQTRYERFWRIFPAAAAYPLPARPGFTANGQTDGAGYMMACWVPGWSKPTQLRHIDNRFIPVRWDGRPDRLDPAFPDPRKEVETPMPPEPLLVQRRLL